jgi:flavin-dependent dehydrogenase
LANVGLGLVHRDLKRRGVRLRDVHEAVLKLPRLRARFARAERIGPLRGWNLPTPDTTRTLSGEGFLLAGDAAGLVDPFSGEGIGNALVSGRVAAESIAEALGERNRGRALERYPARLWTEIDGQEIALHYRLRSLARHGRVIDLLVGRAAAHTDVLDWLRAMTAAHGTVAKKRALFSPLAYARLAFKRGGRGSRF